MKTAYATIKGFELMRMFKWTCGNMAKVSQEKSASLKGNSVSTAHNQSDQGHSSGLSLFLQQSHIRVITIKQNLDITRQDMNSKIIIALFSLFAELERDLVSLRTREALAAKKAQGQPLGTLQKSKFDKDVARINDGILRHPVYGNREVWVSQDIRPGFFDDPVRHGGPEVRREIEAAVQRVIRKITTR